MAMSRNTGWHSSGFDSRDFAWVGATSASADAELDVPYGPRNQGGANCCIAIALVTAMEILDARRGGSRALSPLFNYYYSRASPRYTGSVSIRESLSCASELGVCEDREHRSENGMVGPYTRTDALRAPSVAARASAERNKVLAEDPDRNTLGYYTLDGPGRAESWRQALLAGSPIIFGFYATESYWQLQNGGSAEVRSVDQDRGASGHAAAVVGFENDWFRVRDSRGLDFANRGEWRLHADVVARSWVAESWAVAAISYDS